MEIISRIDEIGKAAWIALVVLAFVVYWPLGLALLVFLIWSGRLACGERCGRQGRQARWRSSRWHGRDSSSGNAAFDEYRQETLKRLEDEQQEFKKFLDRLRKARDKAEFDEFMAEHRHPRPSVEPDEPSEAEDS